MGARRSPRFRARRGTLGVLALIGMLAACQAAPNTPPGTGPLGSSPGPAPSAAAAGPTQGPEATPGPPTTTDLIEAALAAGTIDAPTALLDRVYAFVGDPRLPAEFAAGVRAADDSAILEASAELDTLPPAIRNEIIPFTLRPTDPRSPWNGTAEPAAGVELANVRLAGAAVCQPDGWAVAAGQAPFNIWIRCGAQSEVEAEGVAQMLDALWTPMTGLMGQPIPDENVKGVVGDGRIDVYLVNECITRGGRCLEISATAVAMADRSDPIIPVGNAWKSSGFLILSGDPSLGFDELRHDMAHEFFHVLEFAHNTYAPFGGPAGWFGEASSTWAESHFTRTEAASDTTGWFSDFQDTSLSLQRVVGDNAYASFMWPYFMEQERGATSVAAAWGALEGKVTPAEMNQAISSELPFKDAFRDFAVRALNQGLDPGDPIEPRFSKLDPAVSTATPGGLRLRPKIPLVPSMDKTVVVAYLSSLWASYTDITVDPDIRRVTLSFTGLTPADALDVDVLVKIKDKGWERRKLSNGDTSFCRNKPADDLDELWLVLSNHDMDLKHPVQGSYTIKTSKTDCSGFAIEYHYTEQWNGGLAGTDLLVTGNADVPDDPEDGTLTGEGMVAGSQYKGCPDGVFTMLGDSATVSGPVTLVATGRGDVVDAGGVYQEPELVLSLSGFLEISIPLKDGVATRSGGQVIPDHAKGINGRGCGAGGTISWTIKVTALGASGP
jgi:hypothetical protein